MQILLWLTTLLVTGLFISLTSTFLSLLLTVLPPPIPKYWCFFFGSHFTYISPWAISLTPKFFNYFPYTDGFQIKISSPDLPSNRKPAHAAVLLAVAVLSREQYQPPRPESPPLSPVQFYGIFKNQEIAVSHSWTQILDLPREFGGTPSLSWLPGIARIRAAGGG